MNRIMLSLLCLSIPVSSMAVTLQPKTAVKQEYQTSSGSSATRHLLSNIHTIQVPMMKATGFSLPASTTIQVPILKATGFGIATPNNINVPVMKAYGFGVSNGNMQR